MVLLKPDIYARTHTHTLFGSIILKPLDTIDKSLQKRLEHRIANANINEMKCVGFTIVCVRACITLCIFGYTNTHTHIQNRVYNAYRIQMNMQMYGIHTFKGFHFIFE